MNKLTPKQERFCLEYIRSSDASEAYRKAYNASKMNGPTVNRAAKELMDNPKISTRIDELRKPALNKALITQERVLQELSRIAFFDPKNLFDSDGRPVPVQDLDDDTAAVIAGLDVHEEYEGTGKDRVFVGYTKKIKLADKSSALTLAMRHLGMLNDKLQVNMSVGLADKVKRARERQSK